jgi:hypothetical protein
MASSQSDPDEAAWRYPKKFAARFGSSARLSREPIMKLVNGRFGSGPVFAPHLRLVFSEESPQLTVTRGISKVCKILRRDAINDD